jgi:hypothetical protein
MFANVNLAMTGWMEQSEIVEPVRATFHFPDHVMGVPFGLQCDEVIADQTPAILSLPEDPVKLGLTAWLIPATFEAGNLPTLRLYPPLAWNLSFSCFANLTDANPAPVYIYN